MRIAIRQTGSVRVLVLPYLNEYISRDENGVLYLGGYEIVPGEEIKILSKEKATEAEVMSHIEDELLQEALLRQRRVSVLLRRL